MANWASSYNFTLNTSNFETKWNDDNFKFKPPGVSSESYPDNNNFIDTGTTVRLGSTDYHIYKSKNGRSDCFCVYKSGDIWFSGMGNYRKDSFKYKITDYHGEQQSRDVSIRTSETSGGYTWYYYIVLVFAGAHYYYRISFESDELYTWHVAELVSKTDPVPSNFQPLQPVEFTTQPSITYQEKIGSANSASMTFTNVGSATTEYISFSTYYTNPGVKQNGTRGWYISITITDWSSKTYEIVPTGSSYSIYTGKTVGNDFLSAFRIRYRKANSYGSYDEFPKTALELSKMSKTIVYESDANLIFNYDISDITETSTTSITSPTITSIHRLASGSAKFNNIVRPTTFSNGDTIQALTVANGGSLTYDDDTTITLSNANVTALTTVSNPSMTLPHTVSIDTPSVFTLTYTITTTYFGILQFTDNCTTDESTQVSRVTFGQYQRVFTPNQAIVFGSNATLKVYNSNNQLLKTITGSNIGSYATNLDQRYGQLAKNCLSPTPVTLTFMAYGVQLSQKIGFTYDETALSLSMGTVPLSYIFDPEEEEENLEIPLFTGNNFGVTTTRHIAVDGVIDIITYSSMIGVSGWTASRNPVHLDYQRGRNYAVTISKTNEWGQQLTGTFEIYAEPLAPQHIVINTSGAETPQGGEISSIQYYDNDNEKFKLPVGITLTIVYNDQTANVTYQGTIANLTNEFSFFRDANHQVQLTVGTSTIKRSDGNNIYVHSNTYNVDGYFSIDWEADEIRQVSLASSINVYYGNKLSRAKSQVILNCLHASGLTSVITDPNDFNFSLTSIILEKPTKAQCKIILTNIGTFEIENYNDYIIWNYPYPVITFDLTDFQTEYNNDVDVIYPDGIKAKVLYYEEMAHTTKCDYEQECTYSDSPTASYNKFTVEGLGDLANYNFGSQQLNITMSGVTHVQENIKVIANLRLYGVGDSTTVYDTVSITVIEIISITGLKLLNAKTEYNVGETYLNEADDTRIMIFYIDSSDDERTYTCYLRSGLTALNIYPLKGTEFKQVAQNKVVTITSANNYNVSVQYSIDVKANYHYDDTKKHNLVAILLENYMCPDLVQRTKYFLVERTVIQNGLSKEATAVTGNGRILNDGVDVSELNVFGYLEDIGDGSMNAKVILFKDYIAPIEGSNNITVKFPCYVEGNADIINKCHFGIMFGNNNSKNRLFLSGNPDYKNKDWHSGQVDSTHTSDEAMLTGNYGYFEDLSECIYGETDNAVVGYDIVANDKLLVLKDYSDKETTIYFRQPQLVTAINTSGTSVTGLDDETLYQEEFSLTKGNNSVAGVNPKAIVNFNGDSLFISNDKHVVGLDLTGIVGDNQRYANPRSYYIDEELKNHDLEGAMLWTDNKYLFVILKTKIYISHFETKHDNQYEWFIADIAGVTSVLERNGVIYFGFENGEIFKVTDIFKDAKKVFAGYGVTRLSANENTELITASEYLSELDTSVDEDGNPIHKYFFKPVPFTDMGEDDDPYIYYSLGTIRNETTLDCDFYVDNTDTRNVLRLVCRRNGEIDNDARNLLIKRISEVEPVYFNKIDGTESIIICKTGSVFEQAYGKKYYLRKYSEDGSNAKLLYQVINENGEVMPVKELYRARMCMRVIHETEMVNINVSDGTFQLKMDGEILNIVQYSSQSLITAFRGEIIEYSNVEAFYITKPYEMGSLEYLKTIWSFTLTNDTNIPSELDLCYATNKIPYENMKTLAYISKDTLGFDISTFNFSKVDFDKNVVPRTYTHKRVLSGVKFVCFGFRNYKDSNSILSSMTVTYTVPYPSYSGD